MRDEDIACADCGAQSNPNAICFNCGKSLCDACLMDKDLCGECLDKRYIRFSNSKIAKTVEIPSSQELFADLDAEGNIVGIEVLSGTTPECIVRLKKIADAAETFVCQWLKIKQFLTNLPGSTKRGDDLYDAVFGVNNADS
jgi:uncharacterized protein YuzE